MSCFSIITRHNFAFSVFTLHSVLVKRMSAHISDHHILAYCLMASGSATKPQSSQQYHVSLGSAARASTALTLLRVGQQFDFSQRQKVHRCHSSQAAAWPLGFSSDFIVLHQNVLFHQDFCSKLSKFGAMEQIRAIYVSEHNSVPSVDLSIQTVWVISTGRVFGHRATRQRPEQIP